MTIRLNRPLVDHEYERLRTILERKRPRQAGESGEAENADPKAGGWTGPDAEKPCELNDLNEGERNAVP